MKFMKFSKTYLYKFIRWVACSFERCSHGASARKLTMWSYVLLVGFLHFIVGRIFIEGKVTETQSLIWILLGFLIIDTLAILLLAQILTSHDITEFIASSNLEKDEKSTNTPPE